MDRLSTGRAALALVVGCAAQVAGWSTAAQAGDAAAGRAKARVCQVCHSIDGVGKMPTVPNIGGESAIYLTKQLKAFRAGERADPQMSIVAKPLTDEEIANLAAWYSSIKFSVTLPQ